MKIGISHYMGKICSSALAQKTAGTDDKHSLSTKLIPDPCSEIINYFRRNAL
jgi:hypothetical protein